MYTTVRKADKFDTDRQSDLDQYNKIINNPLCVIIKCEKEKLTEQHMDENGKPISRSDRIVLFVEWEEKVLL